MNDTIESLRAERDKALAERDEARRQNAYMRLERTKGIDLKDGCPMILDYENIEKELQEIDTLRADLATLNLTLLNLEHDLATAKREVEEQKRLAEFHKNAFLLDWQENEAALEKAGIDFTPDESGGKPIITAIEEIIADRDCIQRELNAVRACFSEASDRDRQGGAEIDRLQRENVAMRETLEQCERALEDASLVLAGWPHKDEDDQAALQAWQSALDAVRAELDRTK